MPTLTMWGPDPCPQCGYVSMWLRVASFRVNARSLRQTSPGIAAQAESSCPECGFSLRADLTPRSWWLKPADQAVVDSIRERRRSVA